VVKSAKTNDDFEARRFAEDLYYQLEGRARRGEPLRSRPLRKVVEEWAEVLERETRPIGTDTFETTATAGALGLAVPWATNVKRRAE
jgi:hypothetical protein